MLEFKHAEEKLAEYEKKSAELFSALKEAYHLGDENPEEIKIGNVYDSDGDEVVFEWGERRDIEYVDDMVALQRAFVMLLGSASGAGKASGVSKERVEALLAEARRIKRKREEDVSKAQEVIAAMDEIIEALR
ncbi:MAG: hypothetical protein IJU94_05725 [Clostridia bacterium]|nr:hypothetical protein [Clostridia bacterium]